MSAPAQAPAPQHIHLPSVHIRSGGAGFDYDEDLYIHGRGRRRKIERVVRLVVIEGGREMLVRETRDELCPEEVSQFVENLPVLMEEGNPAANAMMKECARLEFARQLRIASGVEVACARCGCSESRGCSGGCLWVTDRLCSRCA